ncbi:MAG: hypothetical protein IJF96_02670 [Firmicutes bacterium]|nr:hypothetical protein [Bacillota bacterium]
MVKKIRVMLDYKCYPVWLYDEDENIVDTLLPEELRDDVELDSKFDDLQARYDALFIDDGSRFEYVGFESDAEKESFLHDWEKAVSELIQKSDGKYEIIDEINKAF